MEYCLIHNIIVHGLFIMLYDGAMERLLMARFIGERQHQIPEALKEVAADPVMYSSFLTG